MWLVSFKPAVCRHPSWRRKFGRRARCCRWSCSWCWLCRCGSWFRSRRWLNALKRELDGDSRLRGLEQRVDVSVQNFDCRRRNDFHSDGASSVEHLLHLCTPSRRQLQRYRRGLATLRPRHLRFHAWSFCIRWNRGGMHEWRKISSPLRREQRVRTARGVTLNKLLLVPGQQQLKLRRARYSILLAFEACAGVGTKLFGLDHNLNVTNHRARFELVVVHVATKRQLRAFTNVLTRLSEPCGCIAWANWNLHQLHCTIGLRSNPSR
mmetsp:Transcript_12603/g.27482  ORF Transcript_12603/g.27482 Transcript_12603/m.27482 type:complete len:265 (+) Transcript_12603:734-1528(+)